jgi:hypothetical protein
LGQEFTARIEAYSEKEREEENAKKKRESAFIPVAVSDATPYSRSGEKLIQQRKLNPTKKRNLTVADLDGCCGS